MFKSTLFQTGHPVREPMVFICYRHLDSKAHVGRLRDGLKAALGPESVFLDNDDLKTGREFPKAIADNIRNCDALLVVIGPNWLGEENRRRLHEPEDFVLREITAGLRAEGVTVMPVLVDGAKMPRADELPKELEAFTHRTAIKISDDHWDYDIQRLLADVRGLVPHEDLTRVDKLKRAARTSALNATGKPMFIAGLVAVVVAALSIFVFKYLYRPKTLDECLPHVARNVRMPRENIVKLEAGMPERMIINTRKATAETFVLKFEYAGQDLGAVVMTYDPHSKVFAAGGTFDIRCESLNDVSHHNEDHSKRKQSSSNTRFHEADRLILQFGVGKHGMPFRLRIRDDGENIRASFNIADDHILNDFGPRDLPDFKGFPGLGNEK